MIPETVNTLAQLEYQAEVQLKHLKQAYWNFVEALQVIRASGEWQWQYITWEKYIEVRWLPELPFKSYSRIRQLESAYSVMQLVRDVTNVTLNENQIRKLRHVIPPDDIHLMPEIVSIVFEYTSTPSERHYLATYEIIKARNQHGSISLNGDSIELDVTKLSAIESMIEADKRYKEHIANGKWKNVQRYEPNVDNGIQVLGLQVALNQRVLVIVQELKEDSTEDDNGR